VEATTFSIVIVSFGSAITGSTNARNE